MKEEDLKELAELCDELTNLVSLMEARKEEAMELFDALHDLETDVTEYDKRINRLYESMNHQFNLQRK